MERFPTVLKEVSNPDLPLHIGGILSGDEPMCKKISECEKDLIG
ncbi:MAG: hypothetical protein ACR2F2_06050 [Pyrinomonadaceae bacterium]